MGFYNKHILPLCLDKACGIGPITKQREKVVPLAEGVVLEIGIGSGQNLPHYNPNKVSKIIGVDPDEHIWKRSETRRAACPIDIERIGLSGEDIPLGKNTADSVVVTYSLCTIPNPIKALEKYFSQNMAKLLTPKYIAGRTASTLSGKKSQVVVTAGAIFQLFSIKQI